MRGIAAAFGRVLIVAMFVSPAIADAQEPTPTPVPAIPIREHLGVGVATTGVVGALPWAIVSVRISLPMGTKFGLDVDVGQALGTKRLTEGQVPTGDAIELHVRWLYKGRAASGVSGYVFGGPRLLAAKNIDPQGHVTDHKRIQVFDLGWGLDRLMKTGARVGMEFGSGGGEGPLLFADVFVTWGHK